MEYHTEKTIPEVAPNTTYRRRSGTASRYPLQGSEPRDVDGFRTASLILAWQLDPDPSDPWLCESSAHNNMSRPEINFV